MGARLLGCAVVALLLAALAPAASAAGWSVERMAIPQTVQGQTFAVSCGAPAACEGVGQIVDAHGNTRALAEAWNGSSWTAQSIPSVDAPVTYLNAVSCAAPDSCVAIGAYQGTTRQGMVAARWDGIAWTMQSLPNPAHETPFVNSVSCAAVDACTAVGSEYENRTGAELPLIEVWNGRAWRPRAAPLPPGAQGGALTAVSCAAATVCAAVGGFVGSTGDQEPMAESRTGSTWHFQAVAVPQGSVLSVLNAVSCTAPDACTAVGEYAVGNQQFGLGERWNGFAWAPQAVPSPTGTLLAELAGVSCTSASACTAVGAAEGLTSASEPLAVAWNGTGWTEQPTPREPGGFLGSVSCAGPTSCMTVGAPGAVGAAAMVRPSARTLTRPGLLASLPGFRLKVASVLLTSAGPAMYRPAPARVRTAAAVAAAGARTAAMASLTLAEHWDGVSWSAVPTPALAGAAVSQAIGVSCGSPTLCFATGAYIDSVSGAELPLLEQFDGTNWSQRPLRTPPGALLARLFDVSCSSATACMAVGEAFTATSEFAFAERWDGAGWTLESVPGSPGLGSALGSVSCTSPDACTAVGALIDDQAGTLLTLAEFWNGSTWAVQRSANQAGNTSSSLYGVSCTSADWCMATGNYNSNDTGMGTALSEVWSGGPAWGLQDMPTPPNPSISLPDPVSCTAPDACTAVATAFGSDSFVSLALRWDGTGWTSQTVPASVPDLYGVGCVTGTACLAVSETSGVWNGTRWKAQPLAPPPVGISPSLNGISCSAGSASCTGVGSALTSQAVPLAERYS